MIVRVLSDNTVVIIKSIRPEQEDEFMQKNPTGGFRKVDSLPESRYDYYKLDTDGVTIIVDQDRELQKAKEEAKRYINQMFLHDVSTGVVTSSLGFDFDANETSLRNVSSLIDYLDNDTDTVTVRDYNGNFHNVTRPQLITLKKEIIQFGLDLYNKKWQKESDIDSCTTLEEIDNIQW